MKKVLCLLLGILCFIPVVSAEEISDDLAFNSKSAILMDFDSGERGVNDKEWKINTLVSETGLRRNSD